MRLDATLHSDCFDGCVREVLCRGIAFMHVMSMETVAVVTAAAEEEEHPALTSTELRN